LPRLTPYGASLRGKFLSKIIEYEDNNPEHGPANAPEDQEFGKKYRKIKSVHPNNASRRSLIHDNSFYSAQASKSSSNSS
jgi:hypothetical protein